MKLLLLDCELRFCCPVPARIARVLHILERVVTSVLVWSSAHWHLTQLQLLRARRSQFRMLRIALGIHKRDSEEWSQYWARSRAWCTQILDEAKVQLWTVVVARALVLWWGHVRRLEFWKPDAAATHIDDFRGPRELVQQLHHGRLLRGNGQSFTRTWTRQILIFAEWSTHSVLDLDWLATNNQRHLRLSVILGEFTTPLRRCVRVALQVLVCSR